MSDAFRAAADVLASDAEGICARWARRIAREVYADRSDLTPPELEDSAALLVRGIAQALRRGEPSDLQAPWTRAARDHAVERRDQAVPMYDVIREYEVLRQEMWDSVRPALAGVSAEEAVEVAGAISSALYTVTAISASAFQELLRESEERCLLVLASSPDIVFSQDRDLRYTFIINPAPPLTEKDVLGKTDFDLLPEDEAQRLVDLKRRVIETGIGVKEDLLLSPGGIPRYYEASYQPRRDQNGQITGIFGYVRDITDRVQVEKALERERAREQAARQEAEAGRQRIDDILESISDAFFTLDEQARFTYVNARAAQIWGFRREDLIGRSIWEFFPQFKGTDLEHAHRQIISAREPFTTEFKYPQTGRWIRLRAFPRDGGISAYFEDITDRKQAEEERERLLEQLDRTASELESTVNSMAEGVVIYDDEGRITRINPTAQFILGYSESEGDLPLAERIGLLRLQTPEGKPLDPEQTPVRRALRGETVRGEVLVGHPPGRPEIWVIASASPICTAEGRQIGAVLTFTDITRLHQLQEERERLANIQRLLLESTDQGIYGLDLQQRCTFVNRAASRMLGYRPEELIGQNMHEAIHYRRPDGSPYPPEECPIRQALEAEQGVRVSDEVFWRRDGTPFPVEYSSLPIVDDDEVQGAVVAFNDITERRQAEEALRESERLQRELAASLETERARLAAVLESLPVGIWIADREGRLIGKNRQADLIWAGEAPLSEQVSQYNEYVAWRGEGGERLAPEEYPVARVLRTGQPVGPEELRILRFDGSEGTVLVSAAPIRDDQGQLTGVVGVNVDITERKAADKEREELVERLRESNEALAEANLRARQREEEAQRRAEELQAVIDSISDGLIVYGQRGEIVRMNPPAEEILGVTFDQWKGMTAKEQARTAYVETPDGRPIAPDDTPSARALRGERVSGYRMAVRQPSGQVLQLLGSASPIRGPEGSIVGAVAVFNDITELVELQRMQQEMASTVAHDIRQPLTIIQGQAQLQERWLQSGRLEQAKKSNEAILTSARRMNVMIQDLVDSVRIEAGRLELERRPLDLEVFLSSLLQRASAAFDVGRVRLWVEEGCPPAWADPDRLERVVLNLLSNALKYSDPGTPVDLRVQRRDHEALVTVEDRGIGISSEDLPHLFQRFYRARGRRQQEGLGLGLYISRVLVEAHGGRIWVESEESQGSKFYFTVPLVGESAKEPK